MLRSKNKVRSQYHGGGLVFDGNDHATTSLKFPSEPWLLDIYLTPWDIDSWRTILSARNSGNGFVLAIDDGDLIFNGSGPITNIFEGRGRLTPNRPLHLAIYHDGQLATLFINGEQEQKQVPVKWDNATAPNLSFGGDPRADGFVEFGFIGVMHKARVTKAHSQVPTSLPLPSDWELDDNVVAFWQLTERSGIMAFDDGPNTFHARLAGATWMIPTPDPNRQPDSPRESSQRGWWVSQGQGTELVQLGDGTWLGRFNSDSNFSFRFYERVETDQFIELAELKSGTTIRLFADQLKVIDRGNLTIPDSIKGTWEK